MSYPIHTIIDYFSDSHIQFVDCVDHTLSASKQNFQHLSSNDCSNLIFTVQGKVTVACQHTIYELEPNTVLHVGPNTKLNLHIQSEQPWQYYLLQYRIGPLDQKQTQLYSTIFSFPIEQQTNIDSDLKQLTNRYQTADQLTKIHANVVFYQLLESTLNSALTCSTTHKTELMHQAVQYMHRSYHKPLSVTQISKHIGVERRRFAYLFEQYTGMTPNHYLTTFRMKRSRELLRTQQYSVAEVAELVGYHDSFYFSRVFKKYNGVSPSDFRKKLSMSS